MADGTRTLDRPEVEATDEIGHRVIDGVPTLARIPIEDLAAQIGIGGGGAAASRAECSTSPTCVIG